MEQTKQHLCEINHCRKPAPTTTICHHCVDDVHRAIYQFINVELDRLHAIALGEERSAEETAREIHSKSGTQDVLDLSTWELHHNITTTWPQLLDGLATRPDAERLYWQMLAGCEIAQSKINGDQKTWANGDIEDANKKLATPMPLDRLITWLWENFRLRVNRQRIYNWTGRGKIRPIVIPGLGYKLYRPKDVLEHI